MLDFGFEWLHVFLISIASTKVSHVAILHLLYATCFICGIALTDFRLPHIFLGMVTFERTNIWGFFWIKIILWISVTSGATASPAHS